MTGGPPDPPMWAACANLLARADIHRINMMWDTNSGQVWTVTVADAAGIRYTGTGRGPGLAFAAVTELVAGSRRCDCGRHIAISDRVLRAKQGSCRWQLAGGRFVPVHNGHIPGRSPT